MVKDLIKSHNAMLAFLDKACEGSDDLVRKGTPRGSAMQKQYDEAKKLIAQAKAAASEFDQ